MKSKTFCIIMAVVLFWALPLEVAFPQIPVYGTVGFGVQAQKGQTSVPAAYAGADISLFRDTTSGFTLYSRTLYYYADYGDERDIQAINEWIWPTKQFDFIGVDWSAGIGFGFLWEFEGLDDKEAAGLGLDLAADLFKDLSVGFTLMWQPIDKQPDPMALMFKVDLSP